ncbi:hypothetical protein [Saccharothrix australiensis]|uniref:hypothetical protein n=1 Tax=Saccharothrix australiensis TaxID=2072 RepID=UPI001B8808E9|nr:hypothetical protein [Saccharothrix australiensis]
MPERLSEKIRYYRTDVTDFRAVVDTRSSDSIPLDTASAMMKSARMMLRSAASTSLRPQGDLRGNYSRLSYEIVRGARMGHTKNGSFIIPVLVPLSEVPSKTESQVALLDVDKRTPEPLERRAVRTLAQSLAAIQQLIIEPAVEPSIDVLYSAVEVGVSRELCRAVSNVLAQPALAELETIFTWADAVRTPTNIPKRVELPVEAQEVVQTAARKLQENRIEPPRTFTGPIVALRHEDPDPDGYITIATVRDGRHAEITIRLPYPRYRMAVDWHKQARTIIAEGEVGRDRGHLTISQPSRCHPVDELYLSFTEDGDSQEGIDP